MFYDFLVFFVLPFILAFAGGYLVALLKKRKKRKAEKKKAEEIAKFVMTLDGNSE